MDQTSTKDEKDDTSKR